MGVERYDDRVLKINIVIGDVVWELVYCYYLQAGRSVNETNGQGCDEIGYWQTVT